MQKIPLTEEVFQGAVSLEITEEYVKPWRIPFNQRELYVPNHINGKAEIPAGVRITFRSNTKSIKINIMPGEDNIEMDFVIDGLLQQTGVIPAGERTIQFDSLSNQEKNIEIYLSQKVPVRLTGLWVDEDAVWTLAIDSRVRWLTYGSSISQCVEVDGPSKTWPALAARQMDANLTCLGFDGNCHLEPMIARLIRDTPLDFISLCVGINIFGRATLSERTFASNLIGFIQIIREKQANIPLAIMSPIFHRNGEVTENVVGLSLSKMRREIARTVELLNRNGDENIYYFDGLELFGEEYEEFLPDGLHPNGIGYQILAERFQKMVKTKIQF